MSSLLHLNKGGKENPCTYLKKDSNTNYEKIETKGTKSLFPDKEVIPLSARSQARSG